MKWARWVTPAAAVGLVLVVSGGRAAAHLESTNGCQGSGHFVDDGQTIDAEKIGDTLVEVPRSDTVEWKGSVTAPPGAYSGKISVDLPPPFGALQIDSWEGNSATTTNSGSKSYNLPSIVPASVEFRLVGSHTDQNGSCSGYVNLEITGGAFDSALAPIGLAGTVLTGAGVALTLRPLFRRLPS